MGLTILTRSVLSSTTKPEAALQALFLPGKHAAKLVGESVRTKRPRLFARYGHGAVTESLLCGLNRIGAEFRYNPRLACQLSESVGVLAGQRTLASVLQGESASGRRILAGPNIALSPSSAADLFLHHSVSGIVVPSKSVARAYAHDLPEIACKIFVWWAGVDTSYWEPSAIRVDKREVCVYVKNDWSGILPYLLERLQSLGRTVNVLRYGQYSSFEYREVLRRSVAVIYLGRTESQGLAQFEAWSCDVPVLVMSLETKHGFVSPRPRIKGSQFLSPAPFISDSVGGVWSDVDECIELLSQVDAGSFQARKWVEMHATIEKAATRYMALVKNVLGAEAI